MLNPDYRDMLSAFDDAGVEYLVVGAYALAVHGHPRATGDLDLWIRPEPSNAERVLRALDVFGAPLSKIERADLTSPGLVFQIGVSPRRIDLLTSIEGVDFTEAYEDRFDVEIEGIVVPTLSREHLIQNKKVLDRPQDRADLARLRENGDELS